MAVRPASTVLLAARIGADALAGGKNKFDYKLLLVKRSSKNRFMPNAHVFPGGVVESSDNDPKWAKMCGWDGDAKELAHRIAAIREVFEEVSILLTSSKTGISSQDLQDWRLKVHNDASKFYDMFVHFNLKPEPNLLTPYSHWITPEVEKYRYDTKFFVAALGPEFSPTNSGAKIDDAEVTALTWLSPEEAISESKAKTITLFPPTWICLSHLTRFPKLHDLLDHCNNLYFFSPFTPISKETILPFQPMPLPGDAAKLPNQASSFVLPGDEAYPVLELAGAKGRLHRIIFTGRTDFVYENSDYPTAKL